MKADAIAETQSNRRTATISLFPSEVLEIVSEIKSAIFSSTFSFLVKNLDQNWRKVDLIFISV